MNHSQQVRLFGFLLAFLGTFLLKSIFIKLAYLEGLDADSVWFTAIAMSVCCI